MNMLTENNNSAAKSINEQASELLQAIKNFHTRAVQAGMLAGILEINTGIQLFHGRIFVASKEFKVLQ
jgi:hypothetical protein